MDSKLKNILVEYITLGFPKNKQKFVERLFDTITIIVSLFFVIQAFPIAVQSGWQLQSSPLFEANQIVLFAGFMGSFILFAYLIAVISKTVKLIKSTLRSIIQIIVITPVQNVRRFTASFVKNSWPIKQIEKYYKRWLDYCENLGFVTSIKPFLMYLEPNMIVQISDFTQLTELYVDVQQENKEYIQQVLDRYQRLAMLLVVPVMLGFFVLLVLPGIIFPVAVLSSLVFLTSFILYFVVWIPAIFIGFKAFMNAHIKRRDAWFMRLWKLAQQEQLNELAESSNFEIQKTLQERIDALRSIYQQELDRYHELQQSARKTETSLDWINRLSREEQNTALWLLEIQYKRIQEENARREKAQLPKRTAWDFAINVAAGLFGALLTYALGLFW